MLEPFLCTGLPKGKDLASLEKLATTIAGRHRELGLL
jgi:hypothetical protein